MDGHGDAVGQLRMWGDPQDTAETPVWGRAIKGSGCVGHKNGVCVWASVGFGVCVGRFGGGPYGVSMGLGAFLGPLEASCGRCRVPMGNHGTQGAWSLPVPPTPRGPAPRFRFGAGFPGNDVTARNSPLPPPTPMGRNVGPAVGQAIYGSPNL